MDVLTCKNKERKIRKVVQTIKESGFYSPEKGYEGLSLTQGAYFGIDLKNGTMLYVRIYPGNIMDVIGFDIHNFTRTVTDDKKTGNSYEIHQSANGSCSIMVCSSRNSIKHHARNGKSRI